MLRSNLPSAPFALVLSLALLGAFALPALGQGAAPSGPACMAAGAPVADPCLAAGIAPNLDVLAALSVNPSDTDLIDARPPKFRTCRCSCGAPCTTDADCGGGRCTAGITCCRMDPKGEPTTLSDLFASPEPALER